MATKKKVAGKKAARRTKARTATAWKMIDIKAVTTQKSRLAQSITNFYNKAIHLVKMELAAGKKTIDRLISQQMQGAKKLKMLTEHYRDKAVPATKREMAKLNQELLYMATRLKTSKLAHAATRAELAALEMAVKSNAALIKMMERTQVILEQHLAKPKSQSKGRQAKAKT
ncbi:MAG: hypothetical protein L0Y67_09210 [Gammaproteobacteria bacterium]|nr:hypothetical protein [Gammaproteobacteria bacterium]MCI0591747.1 hypothetical protein [Gammaproteobacteria bacterium]